MSDLERLVHDLVARVDALEQENRALRANTAARSHADAVADAAAMTPVTDSTERHSRRSVLGTGLRFTAAALGAGMLVTQDATPALADTDHSSTAFKEDNGTWAIQASSTSATAYAISGSATSSLAAVAGQCSGTGHGVWGSNVTGTGVRGEGKRGVHGSSSTDGFGGVFGQHTGTNGYGVVGDGRGTGAGVQGRNPAGTGVRGEGKIGLSGFSTSSGQKGVYGQFTGPYGFGVVGDGSGGNGAGVLGRNPTGRGVRGEGGTGVMGISPNGVGVNGEGGTGYGGNFMGARAQLRLVPNAGAGKPTTGAHQVGELYLDQVITLWICTAAGTPGTWKKVNVS